MALALARLTFTTNAYTLQQRALLAAELKTIDFLDNGDTHVTANDHFVDMLNKSERQIITEHPALALASTSATATADTRTVTIPVAVDPLLIDSLRFELDGSAYDDTQIMLVDRPVGEAREGWELNDASEDCPRFCYIDETRLILVFSAKFAQTAAIRIIYQSPPQTFTTSDLTYNDTSYSSVPDQYIDALVALLASKFCFVMGRSDREQTLLAEYQAASDRMSEAIRGPYAVQARHMRVQRPGQIGNSLTPNSRLGAFPSFG